MSLGLALRPPLLPFLLPSHHEGRTETKRQARKAQWTRRQWWRLVWYTLRALGPPVARVRLPPPPDRTAGRRWRGRGHASPVRTGAKERRQPGREKPKAHAGRLRPIPSLRPCHPAVSQEGKSGWWGQWKEGAANTFQAPACPPPLPPPPPPLPPSMGHCFAAPTAAMAHRRPLLFSLRKAKPSRTPPAPASPPSPVLPGDQNVGSFPTWKKTKRTFLPPRGRIATPPLPRETNRSPSRHTPQVRGWRPSIPTAGHTCSPPPRGGPSQRNTEGRPSPPPPMKPPARASSGRDQAVPPSPGGRGSLPSPH